MKARNNKSTLKRLSRDILSQRYLFALATVGTIVQVALTVYLPILIGDAVDAVLKKNAVLLMSRLIWQMLVVIIANSAIQWLNPLIYNRLIYSYSESLRERVMLKIHAMPLSYLDRQGTGDMVSRVTTDSDQLNNGLLMVFNQFFVGLLTIFVIIITMARLDWFMMLLVLVMTPLSMLVARFIAKKSYQLYRNQTKWRGMQTQLIEESLTQEALVQSLNAQDQMVRSFKDVNGKYADYSQGAIFYSSAVNPATRFVNSLIYALIVGVGAYRIMSGGAFTVGQLTTFLNYVTQYTKPFNDISSVLSELQSALACADRLYMILDEDEIPETGNVVLEEADVQGRFKFDHVQFGYLPNKPLIKDLSIDIPAASTVAIVESEKTALIAALFIPDFVWLATGGMHGSFNSKAMQVLCGREVILFPDLKATEEWKRKTAMLHSICKRVTCSDLLEKMATDRQREAGLDIADFLLMEDTPQMVLARMVERNPALHTLIDTFDLELVDAGQE